MWFNSCYDNQLFCVWRQSAHARMKMYHLQAERRWTSDMKDTVRNIDNVVRDVTVNINNAPCSYELTVDIWAVFTYTVPLNCPLCSINHLRRQTAEYDYLLILELGKLPLAIFRFTNDLFPLRQHSEILNSYLANIWI